MKKLHQIVLLLRLKAEGWIIRQALLRPAVSFVFVLPLIAIWYLGGAILVLVTSLVLLGPLEFHLWPTIQGIPAFGLCATWMMLFAPWVFDWMFAAIGLTFGSGNRARSLLNEIETRMMNEINA